VVQKTDLYTNVKNGLLLDQDGDLCRVISVHNKRLHRVIWSEKACHVADAPSPEVADLVHAVEGPAEFNVSIEEDQVLRHAHGTAFVVAADL